MSNTQSQGEDRVSLAPLDPEDALRALLAVKLDQPDDDELEPEGAEARGDSRPSDDR